MQRPRVRPAWANSRALASRRFDSVNSGGARENSMRPRDKGRIKPDFVSDDMDHFITDEIHQFRQ
jgi:hypothetical protein